MPKYNHQNLGDVLKHAHLPGVILAVYPESKDTPESSWDTVDVLLSSDGSTHYKCPVQYHCTKLSSSVRDNGAIVDAARGFSVGDECICRCQIPVGGFGSSGSSFSNVTVIGHTNGPKKCSFRYILLRIGNSDLVPLEAPLGSWSDGSYVAKKPGSHSGELGLIYDSLAKKVASVVNPATGSPYVFPCSVESLKPYLDLVSLDLDADLYRWIYQGTSADKIQYASGSPNFKDDFSGELIGVNHDGPPWPTYYEPNDVLKVFSSINNKILNSKKIREGDFTDISLYAEVLEPQFNGWKSASPAFKYEKKAFVCDGPKNYNQNEIPESVKKEIDRLQVIKADYAARKTATLVEIDVKRAFIESLQSSYQSCLSDITAIQKMIVDLGNSSMPDWSAISRLNGQLVDLQASAESSYAKIGAVYLEIDVLNERVSWYDNAITGVDDSINSLLRGVSIESNAISPDGSFKKGFSIHAQTAFGENEFWVCGKNVYNGMIVSLCDEWWKFVRLKEIPPVVPLAATSAALNRLLSTAFPANYVPMADIAAVAALSSLPNELTGNIFDWSALKRVNEGCYHHTFVPAVRSPGELLGAGSYQLIQTEIPGDVSEESHKTAFNSRYEHVCSWDRIDNWHNTINLITHTFTADPTWHFLSIGQQYRYSGIWLDTPLGSMAFHVPKLNAGLWYMYQLYQQTSVARQDFPIDTHVVAQAKHTAHMCAQIYIVQRRAVTLFNKGGSDFVRQINTWGPYDCWRTQEKYTAGSEPPNPPVRDNSSYSPLAPVVDGGVVDEKTGTVSRFTVNSENFPSDDPVCYVTVGSSKKKFFDLSAEEQSSILGERFYITSQTDLSNRSMFPNQAFEIEVMAGCEEYSSLKDRTGARDASKIERVPELEASIVTLIKGFYSSLKSSDSGLYGDKYFSYFRFEAKLI